MTRLRRARLFALLALLAVVSGVAVVLRYPKSDAEAPRPGILETRFDEPAFQPGASADELLALGRTVAEDLVRQYPHDPTALSVQARRHFLVAETEQATALWRQCLELDPAFAEAFFGLGVVALEADRFEEAAGHFDEAWRLDREDPRLPVLLADALLRAGRAQEAILVLEQHIATQRTSAEAWEMLGQCHLQVQEFDRAAECFQLAIKFVPEMRGALYGLARAYAALGNAEQAKKVSERFRMLAEAAHEKNRESAEAFRDRNFAANVAAQTYADAARVHQQHGEGSRAEEALLRAVFLEPASIEHLKKLQQALQARSAHAEAAEVGERIVELAPQELEQWLNLGWLYSQLNLPERAIAACQKAIALNPNDPRCRQAYEILQQVQ